MAIEINQQFPLALKLDSSATFTNFWEDSDAQLISELKQLAMQDGGAWVYLTGGSGSGVSHLLQACSALANGHNYSSMVLSLAELITAGESSDTEGLAGFFDSLEDFDLLCIDDIELLVGQPFWQEQLFYLLEKLRNKANSRLLIGGHQLASQLDIELKDLKSRLKWATGYQLKTLDDSQKILLLQFKAKALGLTMSDEVARFLVNRCSRNIADLLNVLNQLDKLALSSGRRLTVPWIKSVLDL